MTTLSPIARASRAALVALALLLAVELIHVSGVLLDLVLQQGAIPTAVAALGTYAFPGVVVLALLGGTRGRPLGQRLLVGAVVLAVLRLSLQFTAGNVRFVLGLLAVAVALAVLLLALALVSSHRGDGDRHLTVRDAAAGLALGIGATAALKSALGTWDATWRTDVVAWIAVVVVLGSLLWLAWQVRAEGATARPRGLWATGLVVALAAFALANPAYLASQTQSGAQIGTLAGPQSVVVAALAAALFVALLSRWRVGAVWLRSSLVLPLLLVGAYLLPAALAYLALLLAVPATVLLALALLGRAPVPLTIGRTALAGAGFGLAAILPLLVYQIDYDIPLGVPNWFVIVAAGALLASASLAWRGQVADWAPASTAVPTARGAAVPLGVAAGAVVVSLAGLATAVPAGFSAERTDSSEITVFNWNVHYGVTPEIAVDLEALAQAIETEDPDVVALQEVTRGWMLGGGSDIATWLSRRLGMGVVYGPAADRQFGNALLSKAELADVEVVELPYGEGPMKRSAISGTILLADGTPVRVTSVHLQHREERTPTRLLQLDELVQHVRPEGHAVLAGDFNSEPGWPEIEALTSRGWLSAQDAVGDPNALTSPSVVPQHRIDWVFTAGMTPLRADVLPDTTSDHLAIVVTAAPN